MEHLKYRPGRGFTLVELLVVIAIIGMLVGLLLPAVQQAREAARQMQCNNNLRQMGLAALNLESSMCYFPSGGWHPGIVGDPDKGFGREQPGTWAYSLLPFLEQQALWGMGQGESDSNKKNPFAERSKVPIATFYCPSRRAVAGYPYKGALAGNANIKTNDAVAKNDYAANAADDYAETVTYSTSDLTDKTPKAFYKYGVIYGASIVTLGEIRDGTTNTYLFAEKYLDPNCYTTGTGEGDDLSAWNGADNDRLRRTGWKDAPDSLTKVDCRPMQDRVGANLSIAFGSCHSGAFGAVMCDGSVQRVSYSIDPETHSYLGRKADGQIASIPQ